MSSLEEVTNQLMKSVKELADWEYPLSEILEKYYALLEEPTEINFGEAALVVQNSVDVFTKRVDCLNKEVCSLSESFLQHEAEEEKAKSKKERRSRKTGIDFDNFELLDFRNKDVGKNINLKPSSLKPVKLLNRRFPQLEAATTNLLKPIEVSDINSEVIGKKYDFRCNQQLTINGILVDECMPKDFEKPDPSSSDQVCLTSPIRTRNSTSMENNIMAENCTMLEPCLMENISTIKSSPVENSTMIVSSTMAENCTIVEHSTIENSSTIINSTTLENITATENSTTVENMPTIEDSTPVESSTMIENVTVTESNIVSENSTILEHSTTKSSPTIENSISEENKNSQEDTGYFSLSENVTNFETTQETLGDSQRTIESNLEMDTEEVNDDPSHFDDTLDHDDYIEEEQETSENIETPLTVSSNLNESVGAENQVETVVNNDSSLNSESQQKIQDTPDHTKKSLNDARALKDISENQIEIQSTPLKSHHKNLETSGCARNLLNDLQNASEPEIRNVNGNNQSESMDCQSTIIGDSRKTSKNSDKQDQKENESGSGSCRESDSGYRSGESEDYEIPRRRSKRMKNMVCVVNDMNKNVWKPIPFDQGIPEKLPRSRSKFKLPCHISLLKTKRTSRKRKLSTDEVKRKESLSQFMINETESPLKKLNMYSPSRPFMPLKTEELSDFQKSFEDCFKSRQCYDVFHYEAATTITMDLLGFFPSFTKKDPLSNSTVFKTLPPTPEHVSASCSDPGFSPRPTSPGIVIFDTISPPNSPIAAETFDVEEEEEEEEEPLHSPLNYQQLIECRMKEIYEEFDVRTDLEQNVARWHHIIQPKLQEEERRPPFNIHEYSDRIVEKLEECTERKIAFENLIVDQSAAEAARYFSAALQLANTNNVDIQTGDEKTDIELILLDSNITRREISCETPTNCKSKNSKKFKRIT